MIIIIIIIIIIMIIAMIIGHSLKIDGNLTFLFLSPMRFIS